MQSVSSICFGVVNAEMSSWISGSLQSSSIPRLFISSTFEVMIRSPNICLRDLISTPLDSKKHKLIQQIGGYVQFGGYRILKN